MSFIWLSLLLCNQAWAFDKLLINDGHLFLESGLSRTAVASNLFAVADIHKSYDATRVLLTAKKTAKDRWQIFELQLPTQQMRVVTDGVNDCQHAVYLPDGHIAFTVQDNATSYLAVCHADGTAMERITFGPSHFELEGVLPDGRILLSERNTLYAIRPDGTAFESVGCEHDKRGLLKHTDTRRVELVAEPRPRRLWSTLKPELGTGQFIALDSRISSPDVGGRLKAAPHSVRVQSLDANGAVVELGAAPVEADGSFFVSVPADRAVRFEMLDANGRSLRSEKTWIWARSGEERGCVGCHAEKALSPQNHWPMTLKRFDTPTKLEGNVHAK